MNEAIERLKALVKNLPVFAGLANLPFLQSYAELEKEKVRQQILEKYGENPDGSTKRRIPANLSADEYTSALLKLRAISRLATLGTDKPKRRKPKRKNRKSRTGP